MKMNKYQKALNEISSAVLDVYADGYNQPRTAQECYCSSFETLQELVDKADPLEWIPVSERLPEPPRGRNPMLDYKMLDIYLVTVSDEGYPIRAFWDGKDFGDGMFKLDVKAWMPLPNPYKEKENDC